MVLAGVFTPNPHEGTGSKGLGVMRNKVPGNAGHLFFYFDTSSLNMFTWKKKRQNSYAESMEIDPPHAENILGISQIECLQNASL